MADLPVICKTCKTVYPSKIPAQQVGSIIVVGDSSASNVGQCPNCGGDGKLLPEGYASTEKALSAVLRPGRSPHDLEALIKLLNRLQTDEPDRDGAIDALYSRAPKFSGLAGFLPQDRTELYAFIALIIAALTLAVDSYSTLIARSITVNEAKQIAEEAVRTCMERTSPKELPSGDRPGDYKQWKTSVLEEGIAALNRNQGHLGHGRPATHILVVFPTQHRTSVQFTLFPGASGAIQRRISSEVKWALTLLQDFSRGRAIWKVYVGHDLDPQQQVACVTISVDAGPYGRPGGVTHLDVTSRYPPPANAPILPVSTILRYLRRKL
jgi:hypothetical protein